MTPIGSISSTTIKYKNIYQSCRFAFESFALVGKMNNKRQELEPAVWTNTGLFKVIFIREPYNFYCIFILLGKNVIIFLLKLYLFLIENFFHTTFLYNFLELTFYV